MVARAATVKKFKSAIDQKLTSWSIVAFYGGKIDGPGYGGKIHDLSDPYGSFGGACGEALYVKVDQSIFQPNR